MRSTVEEPAAEEQAWRQATRPAVRSGFGNRLRLNARAVYIIWYRDLLRYVRERSRIVGSLAMPLLFLVVFGTGLSSAMSGGAFGGVSSNGPGYVQFIYPGILTMTVLFTAVFSAMSIVWDQEFGFLREVLVAPISRSAVAIGKALGGSTVAMIQATILLLLAPALGVGLNPVVLLKAWGMLFLTAFALSAVGILIAARMRTTEGFQMIMNFLMMPMFFLSGALFPLTGLPAWIAALALVNPVSYGVDPLRRVLLDAMGTPGGYANLVGIHILGYTLSVFQEVVVLILFAAVMIVLGVWRFSQQD